MRRTVHEAVPIDFIIRKTRQGTTGDVACAPPCRVTLSRVMQKKVHVAMRPDDTLPGRRVTVH